MWQKVPPTSTYTWEAALSYCEGLTLATKTDWRLPNINELQSIVDYSRFNQAINTTYFTNTGAAGWWSSTTNVNTTSNAWYVNFPSGLLSHTSKSATSISCYVRAVRGGQCGLFGDSDGDGICDDGDASGVVGDHPCTGGNMVFCDDNCRTTPNANQADGDNDGIGNTCDNCIDVDQDGYGNGIGCLGSDCDDTNSAVHPGAQEVCNGIDDDCDVQTD